MKTHNFITIFSIACGILVACGESKDDTAETTSPPEVTEVTIGVYTKDEQGNYQDTGKTLFFEVGVSCYSWTRQSMPHDEIGNLEAIDDTHDHYNAGDNTSYIDGVFTWTEYGPEHTQGAIDETCAAGVDGVVKSVHADDYYEDHGGLYLRIISAE